ncbi:MAG: tRNA-guanine transglycosylase DpdA [Chloroflexi bacterium]|nr:tRNA-guanine transglycosylase DpdA [Chloroflexota bacterium]
MKFFLPDWDDRVDPGYDFLTDSMTLVRDPYEDDLYAHELFDERVYDGILVSRMALDRTGRKRERVQQVGMRAYLRMPADLELFGDCGAFGYIEEREPIFSTEDVLAYYERLGFDYGVSVDHIVLPEFADQQRYRYELTLQNAEAFLRMHRDGQLQFTPVGAAQGWDERSYVEAAEALVEMGYDYIALGGLARSSTKEVSGIVTAVSGVLAGRARLHVFGVARASLLPLLLELGVTSADSAAPLRQAWLAAKDNYYTEDGGAFAAIRIPVATEGRALNGSLVARSEAAYSDLQEAEREALDAVRAYARRALGIAKTMDRIRAYDSMLAARVYERNHGAREQLYRELLRGRPWERCDCPVCEAIGVEVVIFRGNNRNRRRGFHNLWILRRRMEHALRGTPQLHASRTPEGTEEPSHADTPAAAVL